MVFCPDDDHMEEEVQLRVQEEVKREEPRKGTRQGTESQRTDNTQAHDMDDHVDEMKRARADT